MLVSYQWLSELVNLGGASPEAVAALLTDLGLEAAIVDDRRGWYANVVVGRVVECVKHPNADKLSLTRVDVGDGTLRSIVCGAANVRVGIAAPVALIGAVLPGDFKIEKRKVRGEVSEGMICSASELRLAETADGIMILDDEPTIGRPFGEAYEVCDTVIEVDLTPNRGDCASMIGVAREVAARLGVDIRFPDTLMVEEEGILASSMIAVDIKNADGCPRYAARALMDAVVGPTPFWMRRRLTACGVRSINNIVDVTNYVLMETGHPLHAFDYKKIADARIVVRRAAVGERLTTLDGAERILAGADLVIADGNGPVALAGVMGGECAEVTAATTDILLEAAFFDPAGIRRTAKSHALSSESSYRFERGADVEGLIFAQDRAAKLIADLAGAKAAAGRVDVYPNRRPRREVTIRFDRLSAVAGLAIDRDEAVDILNRLECETVADHGDRMTFAMPTHRWDLEREIDLIEEVIRHVGYDQIAPLIPAVPAADTPAPVSLTLRRKARRRLIGLGMSEGMSLSFMSPAAADRLLAPADHPIRRLTPVDNPLTSDDTHLRTTLAPSMIAAGARTDTAALFEIGTVFFDRGEEAPEERLSAAGTLTERLRPGVYTGRAGSRDFYDAKGTVVSLLEALGFADAVGFAPGAIPWLYPQRQATVTVGDTPVGYVGQVHPATLEAYDAGQELFLFEIDLTTVGALTLPARRHAGVTRFPSVKRDMAVVVDESVTVGAVSASIVAHGGDRVGSVDLFDVFRSDKVGAGKKSLAFSLTFTNPERTLTDDEVDARFASILSGLSADCGAILRG
jgi:phenylalanyl-tRNA synthetase beta chain